MTIVMTGIWWLLVAMIVVSLGMIVMVMVALYDAGHGSAESYHKLQRRSAYWLIVTSVVVIGCSVYGLIHFPS